jgi:hypothetical protein
VVVTRNQNFVQ